MGLRLTAVLPLGASVVAVILTILLLASGTSPGKANDQFWMSLNLSGLGSNLVVVKPADPADEGALGGFINSIPGLDSVLDNITTSIGSGVSDLQGTILEDLTTSLGVKDTYILYVSKMCQGDFKDPKNPNSDVTIDSCFSYRDGGSGLVNISNSIPDGFTVGTAEVSVPVVATLKESIGTIVNLAVGAATAMQVLLIIGCVSSGLTALGSLLGILFTQSRFLTRFNLIFSLLASNTLMVLAFVFTIIVVAAGSMMNGFGSGLSLELKQGGSFLGILWVVAVMSTVAGSYWFAVWFVEFRNSAFSRRSRTQNEIGSWGGIFREVRKDLKVDGHFPTEKDHVLGKER